MSALIEDVTALLVSALAPAGGVWYAANTSETRTYPYVVWLRIVSTPNVALGGPSALQNTRIQIDLYSLTVSGLDAMNKALDAAMAASSIKNIPISSQDIYEDDVRAYRSIRDFSLWASN